MSMLEQRAAVGAEVGREEGKGAVGRAAEAAKNVVTGKDGPNRVQPFHSGSPNAGVGNVNGVARTEAEIRNLANRSVVTGEGDAYCPNPNETHLPKEFETRVVVIQKVPEMKTVEETFFVKEIRNEERLITIPRTRILMEEHERIDVVPVVRQVPRTRMETVHRVVTEEREVVEMVPTVEMVEVPRIEKIPRVITEDIQETISVPVVIEVPQIRTVEVPTGNFCEAPAGEYVNPGHFNLLGKGHGVLKRNTSSSSSSSSDDEGVRRSRVAAPAINPVHDNGILHHGNSSPDNITPVSGTTGTGLGSAPTTPRASKKKPSLFQRIEAKLTS